MKKIRCAIYTRKSSEDGLDQAFNSLDAQREACASYIKSQMHEGWVRVDEAYDDGGLSGGTLNRPALERLLFDVDEGRVHQIVVYKIDRLTRFLADFAKLVDRLDAVDASFVSVTQSFNTATSMGRLTLNVLLSFAQFEREVTAERIRDKVAASKKKGLWMGGTVPMGYQADGRTLQVDAGEARKVQRIFDHYAAHKTVMAVVAVLNEEGLRTRKTTLSDGRTRGGIAFERGTVHHILSNPVYAGYIRHKGILHEGQHQAIIDRNQWQSVRVEPQKGAAIKRGRTGRNGSAAPFAGVVYDETGDRLTPSHAKKNGTRYRYYISNRLLGHAQSRQQLGDRINDGWRLSAKPFEDAILDVIADHLKTLGPVGLIPNGDPASLVRIHHHIETFRSNLLNAVGRVDLAQGVVKVTLDQTALAQMLDVPTTAISPASLIIQSPFTRRRRGVETKLCFASDRPRLDPVLIANVVRAYSFA